MSNTELYRKIFAENLRRVMQFRNKTQSDLVNDLDLNKSAVSTWVNGTRLPRMDKVDMLASYLGVNRSDLIEEQPNTNELGKKSESIRIPVLGSVPAGIPIEAVEDIIDWEDIPKEWTSGNREYFALLVKGDSMYPKYLEGDTIIIRKESDCESGQDCVVYVNGYDATLKRVIKNADHIILQPLNPEYEPKMYEYNDEEHPVSIAGVVVEIRRKV